MAHRAGTVEQVQPVQAALVAGGDDDFRVGGVLLVQQVLAQHGGGHSAGLVLRLEQHDRADVASFVRGLGLQVRAAQHGVAHGIRPVLVLGQHHRQLDHVFGLQFARADAVQHVGLLGHRRGREFQDGAGRHALQGFEGGVGLRVVRFVHHHQRAGQCQQVGQ